MCHCKVFFVSLLPPITIGDPLTLQAIRDICDTARGKLVFEDKDSRIPFFRPSWTGRADSAVLSDYIYIVNNIRANRTQAEEFHLRLI